LINVYKGIYLQKHILNFFNKKCQVGSRCEDQYLNLLKDYYWDERCQYLLNRSRIKWNVGKNKEEPRIPRFEKQNEVDIKFLPSNFISLVDLFSSKCKYCGIYRVTPAHLIIFHKINIRDFSIQQVYLLCKEEKTHWFKEFKERQKTMQRGEKFIK